MAIRRIGHKKSRNGCLRCKTRRVKCDEQRPCRNCVRHNLPCSLSSAIPAVPLQPTLRKAPLTNDTSNFDCCRPLLPRAPASGTSAFSTTAIARVEALRGLASKLEADLQALDTELVQPNNAPPQHGRVAGKNIEDWQNALSPDWMQSLQLLHHYSASVSFTLSTDPLTIDVFRTTVPEIACTHEFLMHGLLALSASHYAHVNPDQRKTYTIVSTQYQNLALKSFSPRLKDLNAENCEAYFLLASFIFLLTTCSIANPDDREDPTSLNDVVQSFTLLQGVKSILAFRSTQRWKENGPLAPLLRSTGVALPKRTGPWEERLEKLARLPQDPLSPFFDTANVQSSCLLAVASLRHVYSICEDTRAGHRRIWLWPFALPQEFIELLGRAHPVALIILAHYAALVGRFERWSWTFQGWSISVMAVVERALDDQWKEWIELPLQCVRQGLDIDDVKDY